MRRGIKTAPMNTTLSDMLDVWREADRIELFESAWSSITPNAGPVAHIDVAGCLNDHHSVRV
jgi:hypothetical protein